VDESENVDLAAAVPDLPQEMCALLRAGRPALDQAWKAFCLPSTCKFSMLAGMKLTLNLLLPGAHIQASPFRPVFKPSR
jgi:hypothetical protein